MLGPAGTVTTVTEDRSAGDVGTTRGHRSCPRVLFMAKDRASKPTACGDLTDLTDGTGAGAGVGWGCEFGLGCSDLDQLLLVMGGPPPLPTPAIAPGDIPQRRQLPRGTLQSPSGQERRENWTWVWHRIDQDEARSTHTHTHTTHTGGNRAPLL